MSGFKFERNLPHQVKAVESILSVFNGIGSVRLEDRAMASVSNPIIRFGTHVEYYKNIASIQSTSKIDSSLYDAHSNILDISMETGTGKTYTYTKMMFELHKHMKISKFIVIVPTLSIKAGTVNFLKAKATKEHFRQEYGCEMKSYIVESKKGKKNKKESMPQAIREFVEANNMGANRIDILIINAGMINSDTMSKKFDVTLFDRYNNPFDAIASVNPFTIVDEPHKFATANKTWANIVKFKSQYIVRYGATFNDDFKNLIYKLSAVDAFNNNLVKGVVTYVEDFNDGENSFVTLKSTDGKEANFELSINGQKSRHKLIKGASLSKICDAMHSLKIENLNKTKVVLSNGLELKKGSTINPYSYAQSLQDKMMEKSIAKHFELEKELLSRTIKIKPLTLFFIDDIEGYRDGNKLAGSLKEKFETIAKAHIKKLLKSEADGFYKDYLEKSLKNISLIHGGYFSKDNTESDEKIEKEISEILHDKESLLSLENVRRFIFSKWTLREGWDNPNVFQICKLRSSGSTTSKLQEVGRGLRLPVNEYMSRVKDEEFDLHYHVDFTEKDFVQSLVSEINDKSGTLNRLETPTKLTDEMIEKIVEIYKLSEETLLDNLDEISAIKRNNDFKEKGFEIVKALYPEALCDGLDTNKVRSGNDKESNKTTIKAGKYDELQALWERINQKVLLEYKIENEDIFYGLLKAYFLENIDRFKPQGVVTRTSYLDFEESIAFYKEVESVDDEILPIVTMNYKAFLVELCSVLNVKLTTLHKVFVDIQEQLDINLYRNIQTVRAVRVGFNQFLLDNAVDKFSIGYQKISNEIHPTKFTDDDGKVKAKINATEVGIHFEEGKTVDNYLFNEIYYDSSLEQENIKKEIKEVIVFTKIPKNSIRIPVAGGGTYSPDFAYVIKDKDGVKTLNLIVETKYKNRRDLFVDEKQKIKHAQELFKNLDSEINVEFKTQFKGEDVAGLIKEIMN